MRRFARARRPPRVRCDPSEGGKCSRPPLLNTTGRLLTKGSIDMFYVEPASTRVKLVNGRILEWRRTKLSASHRALLAYRLQTGEVQIKPMRKQALAITGASVGYVSTVARASAHDRERI